MAQNLRSSALPSKTALPGSMFDIERALLATGPDVGPSLKSYQ